MRIALSIFILMLASSSPAIADEANDIEPCKYMFVETGMPYHRGDTGEKGQSLICRQGYILSHNNEKRVPDWVFQILPNTQFSSEVERTEKFEPDPDLAQENRALLKDYKYSGFDRGHQAPAEDFSSNLDMMNESFYLSNMAPQVGVGFNQHIWAHLEEQVRKWLDTRTRLIVITGPVYDAPDLSEPEIRAIPKPKRGLAEEETGRVTVPAAFYKIVYDPENGRVIAFLMPNMKLSKRKPAEFLTSVADIEERTGIDFFRKLTKRRQRVLESNVSPMWEH